MKIKENKQEKMNLKKPENYDCFPHWSMRLIEHKHKKKYEKYSNGDQCSFRIVRKENKNQWLI